MHHEHRIIIPPFSGFYITFSAYTAFKAFRQAERDQWGREAPLSLDWASFLLRHVSAATGNLNTPCSSLHAPPRPHLRQHQAQARSFYRFSLHTPPLGGIPPYHPSSLYIGLKKGVACTVSCQGSWVPPPSHGHPHKALGLSRAFMV
jgi:hypothetical protein